MMNRIGRYLGYAAIWLTIWVIASWAYRSLANHRAEQEVVLFDIDIATSGDNAMLDEASLVKWTTEHDVNPLGRSLAEVDLGALEHTVAMHHAVESVNAYATHTGEILLEVAQRRPSARLRIDNYDMYLMADGYIFPAKDVYPARVPVITGEYRTIFSSDFSGYVSDVVNDSIASITRDIAALQEQKIPHFKMRQSADAELRKITNRSVRRGIFMSGYEYDRKCEELKIVKEQARRNNIEEHKRIDAEIAAIELQQKNNLTTQKKLEKIADDFSKLTNFVEIVAHDDFWSSEIVQIVLSEGYEGAMQIALVPRSADFIVDMGYCDNLEGKLRDLTLFYEQGLRNIGWDKYSHISLRYKNQIVCK